MLVLLQTLAVIMDPETKALDTQFQSLTERARVPVVAGLINLVPPLRYSEVRVYTPRAPVQTYDREHILPTFDSKLTPGTSLPTMRKPSGAWGVAICNDMDFRGPA